MESFFCVVTLNKIVIVIYPLISLMEDRVNFLNSIDLKAGCLSTDGKQDLDEKVNKSVHGGFTECTTKTKRKYIEILFSAAFFGTF